MNLINITTKYFRSIRQMIIEIIMRPNSEIIINSLAFLKILYHETCLLFLFFKMRRLYLLTITQDWYLKTKKTSVN